MSFNKVLTIQEAKEGIEVPQKTIKLLDLLKEKEVFKQLEVSESAFFDRFAVLVNASRVDTLDVSVDESAQVVVLPRIVGG